jgi:hypothetical protein
MALKPSATTGVHRIGFGFLMRDSAPPSRGKQIREIPVLERMGYA